ncbi:MAG: hypothetical protein K0U13_01630, partial [Chlamydiae bacterium]|nr:hypothetical protein [Chlamydiota bacterium]
MKFELLVALKYLIPRWRQLSVSIISLISILVVSLVVWLAIVFLSISDGIQKRWIDGFVALNAPLKVTPTEEYYNSYYHQIDRYAFASNFSTKSLVQKLNAAEGSAYDPDLDQELPYSFPQNENKDLVKEAWHSVDNLSGARAQIAQVSLCNMKLNIDGSFLSQLCYVTAQDSHNQRMAKRLVAPNRDDIDYFLHKLPGSKESFLKSVQIQTLQTVDYEHPFFAPSEGVLNGCKVFFPTGQQKIIIPQSEARLAELTAYLKRTGFEVEEVAVAFESGKPSELCEITFDRHIDFDAKLLNAETGSFEVSSQIQGITVSGISHLNHLEVVDAAISSGKSCWAYQENGELLIPSDPTLGDGVLLSSSYKDKGVKLGSRGYLSFMSSSSTAVQEQKTPVYVAGFFDPGMVPMANKLLFVSPDLMAAFDGNLSLPDQMFANGINVWLDNPNDVLAAKRALIQELEARGVANYWNVESFYDFEFSRPIL